jgi:hypothetical protein
MTCLERSVAVVRGALGTSVASTIAFLSVVGVAYPARAFAQRATIPTADAAALHPNPDPRVGLKGGQWDAGQAAWNARLVSTTRASARFVETLNSDLAFTGHYVIQGSYDGFQVWDISHPSHPTLRTSYFCPGSQSDVSVYGHLLFVSGESTNARLDCAGGGVRERVSPERFRGVRIFDISDLDHPSRVANIQTCRGSHTHTLLVDPRDHDNVFVYVSGVAGVRPSEELAGCVRTAPDQDPNSALFRIEIIKVPLAHPDQAAIVNSPHILNELAAVSMHGESDAQRAAIAQARAHGAFIANSMGDHQVLPASFVNPRLDSIVRARGGTGAPTAADSAALRAAIPGIMAQAMGMDPKDTSMTGESIGAGGASSPDQCHDITVYPAVGLAGAACQGYGMLLDIRDPVHPVRLDAAADTNFSYWHSATFNNDGTQIVFSDEWGGGGGPKCRATDPREWGADAIFTIADHKLTFRGYYKMPALQTPQENCVAHNGSMIPVPGRDIMVQAWYQGGISVFDWTDPAHPQEIAFFDRGPIDSTRMVLGGYWSAYWYNGVIVGSEITRGLDVLELTPNPLLTKNEIDAAKTVHLAELNVQGQPAVVWPASFSLTRAYLDQLTRSKALAQDRIEAVNRVLARAEKATAVDRGTILAKLAAQLREDEGQSSDATKVRALSDAVRRLSTATLTAQGR